LLTPVSAVEASGTPVGNRAIGSLGGHGAVDAVAQQDPATVTVGGGLSYAAGMTITLTEAERAYLKSQPLARLATVDASGAPQNNPIGAFLDEETGDILIGGHAMGATRKFRNVQANDQVALVVDDLVSPDPWTVRGLEIRGTAVALEDVDPPMPFMSREVIRITPAWVTSWGVDPDFPGRHSRRS
jgi:pyridoxamine 5'-phosphate oxidase family protein